jgi:hypothetical protein
MGANAHARLVLAGLLSLVAAGLFLIPTAAVVARPLRGTLDRSFGHNGCALSDLGDALASSHLPKSGSRAPFVESANKELDVSAGLFDPAGGPGGDNAAVWLAGRRDGPTLSLMKEEYGSYFRPRYAT